MAKFKFHFAISYAGENESVARTLANGLKEHGASVYFAPYYRHHLLGRRMSMEFATNFGPRTRFFVPLISRNYAEKDYPQYEWQIALEESKRRDMEFILPIRLDETPLVGLPLDVAFCDLSKTSIPEAVQLLLAKLPHRKQSWPREWVATFGLVVSEIMQRGELPEAAPSDYVDLCDWLTENLLERLRTQGLENLRFLEDDRNGETLSVRVGFDRESQDRAISLHSPQWWEVLEVLPYKDLYG